MLATQPRVQEITAAYSFVQVMDELSGDIEALESNTDTEADGHADGDKDDEDDEQAEDEHEEDEHEKDELRKMGL